MDLVGSVNGIKFWVIGKDEVVVDRLMWLKVKCHIESIMPVAYSATKPTEQFGTANNSRNLQSQTLQSIFGESDL